MNECGPLIGCGVPVEGGGAVGVAGGAIEDDIAVAEAVAGALAG